jgi:predicted ATP-dependent endonuclease of OLD family
MAKLTVKNVGPIREAELEVKKHTVFIGPQGSGKSTLAKLIAILSTRKTQKFSHDTYSDYNIHSYITLESKVAFKLDRFNSAINNRGLTYSVLNSAGKTISQVSVLPENENIPEDWPRESNELSDFIEQYIPESEIPDSIKELLSRFNVNSNKWNQSGAIQEEYIPSERTLLSVLSKSIWSLIKSDIDLPNVILSFASDFERARNKALSISIPFLNVSYEYRDGNDLLLHNSGLINLSESASGYQSIIPLLLVIEHQRQQSKRRFIIEEPELNLYPTAQKDLIYSLMSGLQPDVEYKDAEWVITTHSPYVLSSFNTLMLAYKVAQKSDELRTEVEKIIPSRCWINPDEFAAYYVDNGTVRSIISEKTGLISDNELDDVSEDLAGEQDQLFELSRSVPRA